MRQSAGRRRSVREALPKISRASLAERAKQVRELPVPILAGCGVALLLALVLTHHMLRFSITLNGEKMTVWRGTSIEKLLDKGVVEPKPGNLLAVDGTLLEEGAGHRCTATIDGTDAELTAKIHRGAEVSITDGGDATEEYTSKEEVIPHGTSDASREFDAYWGGSIHLLSDGKDGKLERRTGKVSGLTVEEVLEPAEDAGYSIYSAHPEEKVVALTFDDGPWDTTTDQILDILKENNAKATFFTIGAQIAGHEEQVRRAHEQGCQVCTHSWDHAEGSGQGVNLTYMSADEQVNEITKGYAAIADVLGEEPSHVTRCPGGNFYGEMINTLWPYIDAEIGWDVDTEDWSLPGTDHIVEMILSVQSGNVVLMHDGGGDRSQTVEALRTALPQLVEEGYKFVTIDELLAYGRGNTSTTVGADGVVSVS